MQAIHIRPLRTIAEMRVAVALQKVFWGDDLESVIASHMLFSLANYGGHVLGAFDGSRMVGLLVGFLGTNIEESHRPAMANLQFVSKRMVVLPEYRGQGIGYRLKLAQRDLAMKQGVRLVTWTYDPLVAMNAHLNIRKLGAVSYNYLADYYGTAEDGGLTTLGSSDRLLVEWWVTHRRVEERINGNRGDLGLKQYLQAGVVVVNPTVLREDGLPGLVETNDVLIPSGSLVLLEIPLNYADIVQYDADLARVWRLQTRELFQRLVGLHFLVTDFIREPLEGRERAFYVLSHFGPQFDFSNN